MLFAVDFEENICLRPKLLFKLRPVVGSFKECKCLCVVIRIKLLFCLSWLTVILGRTWNISRVTLEYSDDLFGLSDSLTPWLPDSLTPWLSDSLTSLITIVPSQLTSTSVLVNSQGNFLENILVLNIQKSFNFIFVESWKTLRRPCQPQVQL